MLAVALCSSARATPPWVPPPDHRAVMLVMDLSGSMWTQPGAASGSLDAARRGAFDLVDGLGAEGIVRDRVGLASFAQRASTMPTAAYPDGYGVPTDLPPPRLRPWLPLTPIHLDPATVDLRIDTYADVPDTQIGSCTNPGPALHRAVNELTSARAGGAVFRAIVFLSDGAPNCDAAGGGSDHLARAYAEADAAWAAGIHVWTVAYTPNGLSGTFMADLVRGDPVATAIEAADEPALTAAFSTVAGQIP